MTTTGDAEAGSGAGSNPGSAVEVQAIAAVG
jgi:hypothetical protein